MPDIDTAFVAPETPLNAATGADQLYLVLSGTIPLVTFVGDISNGLPEHLTKLIGLVIDGVGSTNTVTVNGLPDCVKPEQAP